jgi:hypothetical protein
MCWPRAWTCWCPALAGSWSTCAAAAPTWRPAAPWCWTRWMCCTAPTAPSWSRWVGWVGWVGLGALGWVGLRGAGWGWSHRAGATGPETLGRGHEAWDDVGGGGRVLLGACWAGCWPRLPGPRRLPAPRRPPPTTTAPDAAAHPAPSHPRPRPQVEPLLTAAPRSTRFVLVTATIPQHVTDKLLQTFPGMQAAFGPGLHRTAPGLLEELVDCSGGEEVSLESGTARKLEALDQVGGWCCWRLGPGPGSAWGSWGCRDAAGPRLLQLLTHRRPPAPPRPAPARRPWTSTARGAAWCSATRSSRAAWWRTT